MTTTVNRTAGDLRTVCPHVLKVWREVGAVEGEPWRSRWFAALVPCRLRGSHTMHAARKPGGVRNWTWS